MRKALVASSLLALLLGGCASNPADLDVSGTWINQVAIDAAAKGGPLREALQSFGPNLEWDVNTKAGQARYYNGFEVAEGKLLGEQVRRLERRTSTAAPPPISSAKASNCCKWPTTMSPNSCLPAPRNLHRKARHWAPTSSARCTPLIWAATGRSPTALAEGATGAVPGRRQSRRLAGRRSVLVVPGG